MPNLIEDRLCELLADWMTLHRPASLPDGVPIHVARRDEIRSRPCVVLNASDSKPISAMPHTVRVKLDAHLFSQVDDTPAASHAEWASSLAAVLANTAVLQAALDSETFCLHALQPKDSATTPDESRGRETTLSYEAVVSAI